MVAICLVAVPAEAKSHKAPAPRADCAAHHPYAGWTEVDLPRFPDFQTSVWPRAVRTFAVDQGTPGRVFVTDGYTVFRSTDFGCSWKQVLQVTVPPIGAAWTTDLVTVMAAPGGGHVYIATTVGEGTAGALVLYTSSDGGATFSRASGPTLPYYQPRVGGLVTSPKNTKRAYLIGLDPFYVERSDDAGATWTVMNNSLGLIGDGISGYMVADPTNADVLYLWDGSTGIFRSTDGGTTYKKISEINPSIGFGSVGVLHVPGAPALVISTAKGLMGCNADCTLNGGLLVNVKTPWQTIGTTVRGQTMLEMTNSTVNVIWRYDARTDKGSDVTPPQGAATPLQPLQVDAGSRPAFWIATPTNLYFRAA